MHRSQLTSLVSALLLLSVLLYLGPYFDLLLVFVLSNIIYMIIAHAQVPADQPAVSSVAAVCPPLPGSLLWPAACLCTF
jgi:hypothetical protein